MVNYDIVRQMTLASVEYASDVSEFEKAGLTPIASDMVKPFRVKESPVQMECRVTDIITLGDQGGAGHLITCEVVKMHVAENVIDDRDRIDPHKLDLMGRMGRAYYVRCSGSNVFPIVQAVTQIAIGVDALPQSVRESKVLTGNNIAQLGGVLTMPSEEEILEMKKNVTVISLLTMANPLEHLHDYAKRLLDEGDNRDEAMKVVMLADIL